MKTKHIVFLFFACFFLNTAHSQQVSKFFDTTITAFTSSAVPSEGFEKLKPVNRLDMNIPGKFVKLGDTTLFTEIQGTGKTIVMLHGGPGGNSHYFYPWINKLATKFRVITYDQRGCGKSDYKPGNAYSIAQAVDDLEKLRIKLKINRWIVLGHSYGGVLAQCYAVKYPEHIDGVILVSALPAMDVLTRRQDFIYLKEKEITAINKAWADTSLTYTEKIYNAFLRGFWKRHFIHKPLEENMARTATYDSKADPIQQEQISADLGNVDLKYYFKKCPIPFLMIDGVWDPTYDFNTYQKFQSEFMHGTISYFFNSSHFSFMEEPDKFNQVIEQYINKLAPISPNSVAVWKRQVKVLETADNNRKKSYKAIIQRLLTDSSASVKIIDNKNLSYAFYEQAAPRLSKVNFKKAISLIQLYIDKNPIDTRGYELLGYTYLSGNKAPLALTNFEKAYKLNPSNFNLLNRINQLRK